MTSIRKLAGLLSLVFFCSVSNAQEIGSNSFTGAELITNTGSSWQGCSTATSEGFWGGTSGGPCPGIWTNNQQWNENQIIFSYGKTTLSQTASLAAGLNQLGTGLQINGYNYHWHVKNSNINGTQPGGYDPVAYIDITLYNKDGSIAERDTYDYGYYIPGWTAFTGTRTYSNPYSLSQVDNLQLSVTGQDAGYWAGYYGPEFMHFSLTANYSVDPCATDPLYSTTCKGYLDALLEKIESVSFTEPETISIIPETYTAGPVVEAITEVAQQSQTPIAEQIQQATAQSTFTIQAPSISSTPVANNVQAKVGEVSSGGGSKPTVSTSQILSIISKEQDRVSSTERSTVESSQQQAQQAATAATQQGEAVAAQAQSQSIATSVEAGQSAQQSAIASSNEFGSITINAPSVVQAFSLPGITNNTQGFASSSALPLQGPNNNSTSIYDLSNLSGTSTQQENRLSYLINNSSQSQTFELNAFTANVSNQSAQNTLSQQRTTDQFQFKPIDLIDGLTIIDTQSQIKQLPEVQIVKVGPVVNQNVKDNDLADGVSVNAIATTPRGFESYMSVMTDASFYASKDIYTEQKNVDNARLLRGLSGASDLKHQQMINEQYIK